MNQYDIHSWYLNRNRKLLCGDVIYGGYPTYVQLPIISYKDGKVLVRDTRGPEEKSIMKLADIDIYFVSREKEFVSFLEEFDS